MQEGDVIRTATYCLQTNKTLVNSGSKELYWKYTWKLREATKRLRRSLRGGAVEEAETQLIMPEELSA